MRRAVSRMDPWNTRWQATRGKRGERFPSARCLRQKAGRGVGGGWEGKEGTIGGVALEQT